MENTKKNVTIRKAVLINAISKYSNVIFLLFANSVLARLLTPEEHGVIAIINVFTVFFFLIL